MVLVKFKKFESKSSKERRAKAQGLSRCPECGKLSFAYEDEQWKCKYPPCRYVKKQYNLKEV